RSVRFGAHGSRPREPASPPHAAQDALVRDGRNVPCAASEEGWGNWRKKPEIMKKAPKTGALEWNLSALLQGSPQLLLFLRSSFLLRGGFLGCALHRLILPNIEFCDLKNRNVIHI